jgi:2',3'-cyclic-nucleotide 2'-phosphodiesterase/3'-nucleotidase
MLPSPLLAESDDSVTVSILHTTDLHGHILPTTDYAGNPDLGGFARCATQIRAWRAENPHSLLMDVGDVYQGTAVSLDNRGALMIRALNALDYDGWVVGNHEFDWGMEPLAAAIHQSAMPVLSGNSRWEGLAPGHDASPLRAYVIKEVAGFRIAIIGLTTPALTTWLPPENLRGFEVLDPSESLARILDEVETLRPDAIILAGHMGLLRRDNDANPIGALTRAFPQLTACLGAHTHQDHPGELINGVLYTQADHYGIHVGKVDLTFDRATRRLVHRQSTTALMDHRVKLDPAIVALCRSELDVADQLLQRKVGELIEPLAAFAAPGQASDQERLIGSAMLAALRARGTVTDLAVHGLFTKSTMAAGPKTVADFWDLLPYENNVVTLDLHYADLLALAQELALARDPLLLQGVRATGKVAAGRMKIDALKAFDGSPLAADRSYRVAFNSYDAQSGGGRYPLLAQLAADPANRRMLHPVCIRDALVGFFSLRGQVSKASLLV